MSFRYRYVYKISKYGVVLQDLQKVYPDLVYEDNETLAKNMIQYFHNLNIVSIDLENDVIS